MVLIMPLHKIDSAHAQQARCRASILVIDPSPISLIALAGVLDSQGYHCVCARNRQASIEALTMGRQDAVVCDVGSDASAALETIADMRSAAGYSDLPAVLIAESRWAGLEKKAESMRAATRCLFKPIDPNSLLAVVDQILWLPTLVSSHRRRGTKPNRAGWVTL